MKPFRNAVLAAALLSAGAVHAQERSSPAIDADLISAQLAENGIAATLDELEALAAPSDADRFALGGLKFLRGIERSLQTRWRSGAEAMPQVPVLRLPMPPNPNPKPFDAGMVGRVFTELDDDLGDAIATL